jgi:hypothetical protein
MSLKSAFPTTITCSGWPGHTGRCLKGEDMAAVHVLLQLAVAERGCALLGTS